MIDKQQDRQIMLDLDISYADIAKILGTTRQCVSHGVKYSIKPFFNKRRLHALYDGLNAIGYNGKALRLKKYMEPGLIDEVANTHIKPDIYFVVNTSEFGVYFGLTPTGLPKFDSLRRQDFSEAVAFMNKDAAQQKLNAMGLQSDVVIMSAEELAEYRQFRLS